MLKEFVLNRPNHADGDITMTVDSTFSPEADGFEGGEEGLKDLIATGHIAEVYTGPMAKYKILGKIESLNEDGTPSGNFLEIGSIHELPKGVLDEEVAAGNAVEVTDTVDTGVVAGSAATNETENANVEKTYYYMGKAIASHYMRKVEDKQYHHVRLEDGSEHDLLDAEYKAVMEA